MKTLAEIIGANIRTMREERGMTKYALAKAIKGGDGRDCAVIVFWESGRNVPSAHYLCKLADVFGCSVDELLGR